MLFCTSACFVNWSIDILINMYYTFNNTYTHTHGLHACVYTQHKKEREAHRRTREALRATEDDHKKLKESKLYCLGEDVYTCIHLVYIVVGRMYTCIILKD